MEFNYKWLDGEAREGFYVSSIMKRAWAAQIEMLQDIDEVCQQNNICYFADWGTLLGAVRHRGFIPWDDDLDICMLRKDFDRFRDYVQLPECYSKLNIYTEPEYVDFINRIVNTKTIPHKDENLKKFAGFPYVAGIDVFAMDYLPRDEQRQQEMRDEISRLEKEIHALKAHPVSSDEDKKNRLFKVNRLYKKIDEIYSSCGEEDSDELTIMPLWMKNPAYRTEKKLYDKMIRIPFEQTTICVPAHYDSLLSKKFGLYVKAVRDWDSHDFPFFSSQERTVQSIWGYTFGKYQFQKSDLIRNECESKRPIDYVMEMIPLWRTALGRITLLQESGEGETALQLLEQCQDLAISSGNNLDENSCREQSKEIVHLLEALCEMIYRVYQKILQNEKIDRIIQDAKKCIDNLYALAEAFAQKKRIGIIVDRAEKWEKVKRVYEEVRGSGHDVYVLPVPFYERNYRGEATLEHYEGTLLPEEIATLDYNVNYGINGFDVIIYSNPFDEIDVNTTIHPLFVSENLQKISKKIIFMDLLEVDDFENQDKRFQRALDYYLKQPGVIRADEIWVSTENHCRQYKKALTEFAGQETKQRWDEIIKVHSWKRESVKQDEVKESRKKKLACFIDCSNVLTYGISKIRKLNEILDIFKQNMEQIEVCFFYEQVCLNSIRKYDETIFEQFEQWLQNAKEYFEIKDAVTINDKEVEGFDAYYGDQGFLANRMIRMQKPVMIQSIEI